MNLLNKDISQLLDMMEQRDISSEELVGKYIDKIRRENSISNSYREIVEDEAIERGKLIDKKRENGEKLGSLAGIPIAIADDISTKGIPTRAGSKMLDNYIPPFDATVVQRLLEEDAIILGKVDIGEFGSTVGQLGDVVAEDGAVFALGSDSSGDARYSALKSRILFMKPSYGLVSRYGAIGNTTTFDQIGPMTKTTMDMAMVLNYIIGYDKRDSTCVNRERIDYISGLSKDIRGLKIGLPMEYIGDKIEPKEIERVIRTLEELGAIVEKVSIPTLDYVLPAYKIISSAEIASNAAKYDGIRYGYRAEEYEDMEELYKNTRSEGFGQETKKHILFGNFVVSDRQYEKYYRNAQRVRTLIKKELHNILKEYELLLCPELLDGDEFLDREFALSANMAGLPAMAIPYDESMGLHLVGSMYGESTLLRMAYACEAIAKVGGEA